MAKYKKMLSMKIYLICLIYVPFNFLKK